MIIKKTKSFLVWKLKHLILVIQETEIGNITGGSSTLQNICRCHLNQWLGGGTHLSSQLKQEA
jgi:hypothetical protein